MWGILIALSSTALGPWLLDDGGDTTERHGRTAATGPGWPVGWLFVLAGWLASWGCESFIQRVNRAPTHADAKPPCDHQPVQEKRGTTPP